MSWLRIRGHTIYKLYRGLSGRHADLVTAAYVSPSPGSDAQVYLAPHAPSFGRFALDEHPTGMLRTTYQIANADSAAYIVDYPGTTPHRTGNIAIGSAPATFTVPLVTGPGRRTVTIAAHNTEGTTHEQRFFDVEGMPNLAGGTFVTHGPTQLPAVGELHRFDISWSGVYMGWPRGSGTIAKISGPGTLGADHFDSETGRVHLTLGGPLPGTTTVLRFTITNQSDLRSDVFRSAVNVGTVTRDVNVVWPSQ